ncbi:hypothetical protein TrLO_g15986 [Triparma laevis f. longispina]|uniref:Homeobox domain-containing protein n=1 Tax=Triparma laevis f. longispina TaxID=1714387 RepID=A0A9W7ATX5_9STRA|nr:hypothetical protein TrLO_g15986 [Triparma laevis f. longispina]
MDSDSDNSDTATRISKPTSSSSSKLKSRRDLPPGAVATLKAWLLSPQHFNHPYPSPTEQQQLMQKTGIDKKQLKNWFTNARRRIWKPMLKKQIDSGQAPRDNGGNGGSGGYQDVRQAPQPHPTGGYSNHQTHSYPPPSQHQNPYPPTNYPYNTQQGYQSQYPPQNPPPYGYNQPTHYQQPTPQPYSYNPPSHSNLYSSQPVSMSNLTDIKPSGLVKTDSHAVLMELFTRDQELVRAAAEGIVEKKENGEGILSPPKRLPGSPGVNTWPNFTSVSSLTSIGGQIPGVKSITNLSAQDTKASGLVNVKSGGSIGRADSYAFLEVFFDKNERKSSDDKNESYETKGEDVGLSLDDAADASSSEPHKSKKRAISDVDDDGALAARGLMSVHKSSENLGSLTLPAKMQKSLSQEFATNRLQRGFGSGSNFGLSSYGGGTNLSVTDPSYTPDVKVGPDKVCSICGKNNIDTQLQPCGHMFHGPCLRTSSCFTEKKPPGCPNNSYFLTLSSNLNPPSSTLLIAFLPISSLLPPSKTSKTPSTNPSTTLSTLSKSSTTIPLYPLTIYSPIPPMPKVTIGTPIAKASILAIQKVSLSYLKLGFKITSNSPTSFTNSLPYMPPMKSK